MRPSTQTTTVLVAALLTLSAPAWAQRRRPPPNPPEPPSTEPPPASPEPDATDEARRLFEQGVAQMQELDFAAAVTTFRRSLELRESPSAIYNLGLAQRGAGAYRDAIRTFERFQAVASTRHSALVESTNQILPELRAALGHIRLNVVGGASQIQVDDEAVPGGDGARQLVLDPGRHKLQAMREGYAPAEVTVELGRGQSLDVRLDVSESPLPGRLSVETGLSTAEIRINGERRGLGDYSTEAPAGRYRVEVRASGFLPQRREVNLRPGGVVRIAVTMARRVPPTPLAHRWWFWTAIGVAVTTATVFALSQIEWTTQGPYDDGTLDFTIEALERR